MKLSDKLLNALDDELHDFICNDDHERDELAAGAHHNKDQTQRNRPTYVQNTAARVRNWHERRSDHVQALEVAVPQLQAQYPTSVASKQLDLEQLVLDYKQSPGHMCNGRFCCGTAVYLEGKDMVVQYRSTMAKLPHPCATIQLQHLFLTCACCWSLQVIKRTAIYHANLRNEAAALYERGRTANVKLQHNQRPDLT